MDVSDIFDKLMLLHLCCSVVITGLGEGTSLDAIITIVVIIFCRNVNFLKNVILLN